MRILIYGAGVIGSLYAVLLKETGYDTTIYARGHRLEVLQNQGLLYKKNNIIKKVDIKVIDHLQDNDIYDFIFLTVRENQLYQALKELKSNKSKTIITMVNSIENYEKWESIVGKGKILPAFPGAGGSITNNILDASLTPRIIQPTTFSEITGKKTNRTQRLSQIFKHSCIPFQQVNDMHIWQLCHIGMVVPLANAYYQTEHPESVGQDKVIMKKIARIRRSWILRVKIPLRKRQRTKRTAANMRTSALSAADRRAKPAECSSCLTISASVMTVCTRLWRP